MLNGAHVMIYSTDADADRAFLRDVLELDHVDAGDGWLIFALPPAELGVHPAETNDQHGLSLMCEDITAFVHAVRKKGATCAEPVDEGYGIVAELELPGGGSLSVYQPKHERPT